jgi:hypothetical protein
VVAIPFVRAHSHRRAECGRCPAQHCAKAILRTITSEAPGDEPSAVVNKVLEGKGNYGYNAATGEYGDMVAMGVLDPTKVTRYALQNASSVAGLMLTIDCQFDSKCRLRAASRPSWHRLHGATYSGPLSPHCALGQQNLLIADSILGHCLLTLRRNSSDCGLRGVYFCTRGARDILTISRHSTSI